MPESPESNSTTPASRFPLPASRSERETILVTGGAGFIGSHLCESLLTDGFRVVVVDDFNGYYDPLVKRRNIQACLGRDGFVLFEGDIQDPDLLSRVFSQERIDRIVHLAARAGVRPSVADPVLYERVNGIGTLRLLDWAVRARVRNFLFGSSSSVYGRSAPPFKEDSGTDHPISPYAATKRAGELLAYTYHHLYELPVTALRFFTVYGPRQRPDMAIHKFTRAINEGCPIELYGRGHSSRDYTYISDIVRAIRIALDKPFTYEIINLGASSTTELVELIGMLEEALGRRAIMKKTADQPGDVPISWADTAKAERLLGWRAQVDIREGVRRFVEWYRAEQGAGQYEPLQRV
ncbi:MAG: GDP-mannose 4,6-dehydratase [Candidatus Omnitrophica bacterium]|nr:GDP-mannose 4,6-dehydratase [Candidatus Omnitrophota bacterium]